MLEPGRQYTATSSTAYRFGFNGKENDNDIEAGAQDYGMRIYDGRIGKFLSVDPLTKKYAYFTPYQFAGNTPMQATDLDGLEPKGYAPLYQGLYKNISVKDVPNQYANKAYEATIGNYKGLVEIYAIQDIDKKTYLIFETVHGGRQWYIEYDKNGYKGNVNEFTWNEPKGVGKDIYWLLAGFASPAVVYYLGTGAAVGWSTLSTSATYGSLANLSVRGILAYYRWAPTLGTAGKLMAEFLDESGAAGAGNASKFAKLTLDEQIVVRTLVTEGRKVELLSPSNVSKMADFMIDGVKTELKTLASEKCNINSAITQIQNAFKQGKNVLLNARQYDLNTSQVKEIVDRVRGSYNGNLPGNIEIWTQSGQYKYHQ